MLSGSACKYVSLPGACASCLTHASDHHYQHSDSTSTLPSKKKNVFLLMPLHVTWYIDSQLAVPLDLLQHDIVPIESHVDIETLFVGTTPLLYQTESPFNGIQQPKDEDCLQKLRRQRMDYPKSRVPSVAVSLRVSQA